MLYAVYRVERLDDRRGPYCAFSRGIPSWDNGDGAACGLTDDASPSHPTASFDVADLSAHSSPTDYHHRDPRWKAKHTRFGFRSLDQLRRWFSQAQAAALAERGYVVACYLVPEASVSDLTAQTVFDARYAALDPLWPERPVVDVYDRRFS